MTDVSILGGSDPAPGSVSGIQSIAHIVRRTAEIAQEARIALESVGDDVWTCDWEGEAADSFGVTFNAVPPDLGLMATSYERVAVALEQYARMLEDLQASVAQAVTRARMAQQRRDLAEPKRAAAAKRVGDLARQLNLTQLDERREQLEGIAAAGLGPLAGDAVLRSQQQLYEIQATKHAIERALYQARSEEGALRNEVDRATDELGQARRWGDNLRSQRSGAEQQAALTIRSALEAELHNKNLFEQTYGLLKEFASYAAAGDWGELFDALVLKLRVVLEALDKVVEALTEALLVVGLVLTLVALVSGAGIPAIPVIWAGLYGALEFLSTAGTVISAATLLTSVYLVSRNANPELGKRRLTGQDIAVDGVDLGLGLLMAKPAKRVTGALYRNPRVRKVIIETLPTPLLRSSGHIVAKTGEHYGQKKAKATIEMLILEQDSGGGRPIVGACIAR